MIKSVGRMFGTAAKRPVEEYSVPRLSSSLVLCRPNKLFLAAYDYQVLLLKRKSSNRKYAHFLAFPGGGVDQGDSQLSTLIGAKKPVLATALRQLFEETGIFLSRSPIVSQEQIESLSQLAQSINRDALHGKVRIHNYYLRLCANKLFGQDILIDDLIRLITIPALPDRYDTYFFIKMLESHKYVNVHSICQHGVDRADDTNQLVLDEDEHESYEWTTPTSTLISFYEKKVKLAPPQFIILNILSKYRKFRELKQALSEIASAQKSLPNLQESPLLLPQIVNLVRNTEQQSTDKYPFAATFLGDRDFGFDKLITNEKSQTLCEEMKHYKNVFSGSKQLNRILFKDPKSMFQADFDVQCDAPYSLLRCMTGLTELTERIKAA